MVLQSPETQCLNASIAQGRLAMIVGCSGNLFQTQLDMVCVCVYYVYIYIDMYIDI